MLTNPSILTIEVPQFNWTFSAFDASAGCLDEDMDCDDSPLVSFFQRRFLKESIFQDLGKFTNKKKLLFSKYTICVFIGYSPANNYLYL